MYREKDIVLAIKIPTSTPQALLLTNLCELGQANYPLQNLIGKIILSALLNIYLKRLF